MSSDKIKNGAGGADAISLSVELTYQIMFDDAKLDELAAQGIKAISAPYDDFVEATPLKTLKERAASLASRGIRVDTSHPRFGNYNTQYSMVNQYEIPRKLYLEQLKEGFERLSILGVRVAPIHTGGCCLGVSPEWSMDLCAESLREVVPAAADCGLILALENTFFSVPQHWDGGVGDNGRPAQTRNTVYDDIGKLCRLIDMLDSPVVKGCFDAGHAHYLGDLTGDHVKMGDRILLYHIHDNNQEYDMHLQPGYATLNWEELGGLLSGNAAGMPAFIEAAPWTHGEYALMVRQTKALLSGGRRGENKRCMKCGSLLLTDNAGEFCACVG